MRHILYGLFFLVLVVLPAACSRPDCSEEAIALSDELQNLAISDMDTALERVDSAQRAGVFTDVKANTVKACIYENADLRQMAAYYAEKAIAAEVGRVTSVADSSDYCAVRCILADNAYDNGAYGKSLALAREVFDFTGNSTSPYALAMKCRALSQMADCESELNHLNEAERLFLQSIDLSMEGTQQATSFSDVDPLFYSLLALSDLYLDNGMAERALPLHPKMDTAMTRLLQCPDILDWVVQMRRNNVTISKAMVYAASGQRQQAEALFREHQQSPDLGASDKTAAGVCLTIMARYDEALHLFDEADSMVRSSGDYAPDSYVKTLLMLKYDALKKAGRTEEALVMSDHIRQLTDSLRRQERQVDVEQLQEIKRQEEELIRKRQSLMTHRIVLIATIVLLLMAVYIIWYIYRQNRQLAEKNRQLYERICQQEHLEEEELKTLSAQPADKLSQNQQLYRRLCELMKRPDIYTDPDTNHETLARLLGTNHQYVYAALRECAETTPADFLNLYRIRHAAKLLSTTDDPVGSIIEMSGIASRSTFNRLFREHYSMSPSEFRKAAKQSEEAVF